MSSLLPSCLCLCLVSSLLFSSGAASAQDTGEASRWAPWVEQDFPFFSSVLDLRHLDPESLPANITPRGLVFPLADDLWACFDTELLRLSAVWSGSSPTPVALAPVSYQEGAIKTRGGQDELPRPRGDVWILHPMTPGWQTATPFDLGDPRPPQPSPEEAGRGPLPPDHGRFHTLRLHGDGPVLEYTAFGSLVEERLHAGPGGSLQRQLRLAPCAERRYLLLGSAALFATLSPASHPGVSLVKRQGVTALELLPHPGILELTLTLSREAQPPPAALDPLPRRAERAPEKRWKSPVTTRIPTSLPQADAYVLEEIELPLENPWRRNVRLADLQFLRDGTGAAVTLDGDVWLVTGIDGRRASETPVWHRFASGLHEPMSLAIREDQIFVFDRNGIWRLIDADGNGEAERYELFANSFTQSAETREFPNGIAAAPDGSFIVAKGGQQASTLSRLNGSVLRIAPDGATHHIEGLGFRQPFIAVDPLTGTITASDQEGHYIPTTPLHIVKDGAFHGFLSNLVPAETYPAPIATPLTWIPHAANPSATSQVWLRQANLGPLNDSLIHLGFNRPEIFSVLLNQRGGDTQAAVVSVTDDLETPALHGAVHPLDGFLYVSGFQITAWGTTARRLSGITRLRHTGNPSPLPAEIAAMKEGILIRFHQPLDPAQALDPQNYAIERWNYRRTPNYGSAHYRLDGSLGQDHLEPSSVYLTEDGTGVFVGVPDMKPVMQMRVGWALTSARQTSMAGNAYLSVHQTPSFQPGNEGFSDIEVDLTPRESLPDTTTAPSREEGGRLAVLMGCLACHDIEGTDQPKVGPTWKGLYGSQRRLDHPDTTIVADEDYLRESILQPAVKLAGGYLQREAGMPVYAGVLTDSQVESLLLFIKALR